MDMLIKLWALAPASLPSGDVIVRKPLGSEHSRIAAWAEEGFGALWGSEVQVALANRPVTMFIAQQGAQLAGMCCYDATARGFVGPVGVVPDARGKGIGAVLLLACLHDMRTLGYGYAVAGHVGAPEFFRRVAGALEIPDSTPGVYEHLLR